MGFSLYFAIQLSKNFTIKAKLVDQTIPNEIDKCSIFCTEHYCIHYFYSNAVVTPLHKSASYEPRIAIFGIWGDTWLTRDKYGIYVAVRGSYGTLAGSRNKLLVSHRNLLCILYMTAIQDIFCVGVFLHRSVQNLV